ncbi:conserved hypothetical protein, partial [Ricinus communis]
VRGQVVDAGPFQLGQRGTHRRPVLLPQRHRRVVVQAAETRLAHAQRFGSLRLLDGDAGQPRALLDQRDVGQAGLARLAVVDGEGAQHRAAGADDRVGPAGAELRLQRQVAVDGPRWGVADILDDHAAARAHRLAAGADAVADRHAVDGGVVEARQAGRRAHQQVFAAVVQQQDAALHVVVIGLDAAHHAFEDGLQRRAGGQQFQHVAAGLLALLDLGALGDVAERPDARRLGAQQQAARVLFDHAAILEAQHLALVVRAVLAVQPQPQSGWRSCAHMWAISTAPSLCQS